MWNIYVLCCHTEFKLAAVCMCENIRYLRICYYILNMYTKDGTMLLLCYQRFVVGNSTRWCDMNIINVNVYNDLEVIEPD